MTPIVTVPLLLFVHVVRKISLSFVTSNFFKNHSVKKDKIKCKLMQRKIKVNLCNYWASLPLPFTELVSLSCTSLPVTELVHPLWAPLFVRATVN